LVTAYDIVGIPLELILKCPALMSRKCDDAKNFQIDIMAKDGIIQ
jgi:hypothetical protein